VVLLKTAYCYQTGVGVHTPDTIVQPVRNDHSPQLGPLAVMVASEGDIALLRDRIALPNERKLFMSRLYYDKQNPRSPAVVGPLMGAPYAAALLELVHAWGAEQVLFLGWCGSIHHTLATGDILLPSGALIDEGTSLHYRQSAGGLIQPDPMLHTRVFKALESNKIAFESGVVWTTDAVFRETRDKVENFRQKGARAVEMELSALLSVAAFHHFATAGMLAVSDELFTGQWQPGFRNERFKQSRKRLVEVIGGLVQTDTAS
jgi:purine-nucleoside phosphorylase